MKSERVSGNILVRPNPLDEYGMRVDRHTHNFDHTTFARLGWFLIRGRLHKNHPKYAEYGGEMIAQIASPEYARIRELELKYEPEKVLRPVRFADKWVDAEEAHLGGYDVDGKMPIFDVRFISFGEPVPEGGTEIHLLPVGYHLLIKADVCHEILALSPGLFDCTYSHRDPQGNVIQEYNGWESSYV